LEILVISGGIPPADRELFDRLSVGTDVSINVVSSYKNGIEAIAKHKNAIIILYCFNDEDDFKPAEAVRIMKGIVPSLLVIAISNETPIETERELRKSGLYFHLTSPIREKELNEVLSGAIKKTMERKR